MNDEFLESYRRLNVFRGLLGPSVSIIVIAAAVWLCVGVSWWFLPLSLVIIANRQVAFILYGHEGLHGLLLPNARLNDCLTRVIFFFPLWISLSQYRYRHILHHRFVSSKFDPDFALYSPFPWGWRATGMAVLNFLTGRTLYQYLNYFSVLSMIPVLFRREKEFPRALFLEIAGDDDTVPFVIYQVALMVAVTLAGVWTEYLLLWTLPGLLKQPYANIVAALQHALVYQNDEPVFRNRTVTGPKWLMELVLPADINFHGVHHIYPWVPHYRLHRLDAELLARGVKTLREDFFSAFRSLFRTRGGA